MFLWFLFLSLSLSDTECIYMEIYPPPMPFQICKIEELRKVQYQSCNEFWLGQAHDIVSQTSPLYTREKESGNIVYCELSQWNSLIFTPNL